MKSHSAIKILLIFFFAILVNYTHAQSPGVSISETGMVIQPIAEIKTSEKILIQGKVVNAETLSPVSWATIKVNNVREIKSDRFGNFEIELQNDEAQSFYLHASKFDLYGTYRADGFYSQTDIIIPIGEFYCCWSPNPLEYIYCKITELDPDNLLKDSDDDGVIDRLDKEPDTPGQTPVDLHGVTVDSDKDGCPDSEDPEPFSSPVLPLENCENVHVTMYDIQQYLERRSGCLGSAPEIHLPVLFFDENTAEMQQQSLAQLEYLAELLKKYPNIKLEMKAYRDLFSTEANNPELIAKRTQKVIDYLTDKGMSQSSVKISKEEEVAIMYSDLNPEINHHFSRRLEFYIVNN